jgi:hypothetical protein
VGCGASIAVQLNLWRCAALEIEAASPDQNRHAFCIFNMAQKMHQDHSINFDFYLARMESMIVRLYRVP